MESFFPSLLHTRGKFDSKSPGLLGPPLLLLNLVTGRKEHLRKYSRWRGAPGAISVHQEVALLGAMERAREGKRARKLEKFGEGENDFSHKLYMDISFW